MITIAETGPFYRKAASLFSAEEKEDLIAVFGKNEKANISMEEKRLLSNMVKELVAYWRHQNEQSIH